MTDNNKLLVWREVLSKDELPKERGGMLGR